MLKKIFKNIKNYFKSKVRKLQLVRYCLFGAIGVILGTTNTRWNNSWQFWALLVVIVILQLICYEECEAELKEKEYEKGYTHGFEDAKTAALNTIYSFDQESSTQQKSDSSL